VGPLNFENTTITGSQAKFCILDISTLRYSIAKMSHCAILD
jgi:hypothetical protein